MAKFENPDIIFGTDPDCDRIGVVVKDNSGDYKVLTENQTGMLLARLHIKITKRWGEIIFKSRYHKNNSYYRMS